MKYAVIGAGGQLGKDLCPRLKGEVFPLTHEQADLTRPDSIRQALTPLRPDVVINCAAYNFVDRAETEGPAAFAVNAWGPQALAIVCRELDCDLVHFSTDYVFGLDEDRRTPLTEDDPPGPVSVYGLSKLAGEYLVRMTHPRYFVIRSSGLYGVWGSGGKGGNFVETMLRRASQGMPLRVVADQFCTPTYTADLAASAVTLIPTRRYGLYHLTNAGSCTWHDFAQTIFRTAKVEANLIAITSREFGAAARRPPYSVLSNAKYVAAGLKTLRPWQEAIAAYLEERRNVRK
jgi:dTDP-4-dehydrorhamnose reductase